MNSALFKSICLRFSSGNDIPVERARVTPDEVLLLGSICEQVIAKLKKRLELGTYTLENSALLEGAQQNLAAIELNFPEALRLGYEILKRHDGVAKVEEVKPLLELITKASFSENHLKTLLNSHYGAVSRTIHPTVIPKFK